MSETLHQSAGLRGDVEAVRSFLDQGAAVDIKDERGMTPLMMSSYHGHVHIAQVLIDAGANINALDILDGTPVRWALSGWSMYSHNLKIHRILIDDNFPLDAIAKVHYETFALAAGEEHLSTLNLLLSHGGSVSTEKERMVLELILEKTQGK